MKKEQRKTCEGGICSRELDVQENVHSVIIVDAPYCTPKGAGSAESDPAGETQTLFPRNAEKRKGVKVKWVVVEEERDAGERWCGSAFSAVGGDADKRKLGNGPVSSQGLANHLAFPAPFTACTTPNEFLSKKVRGWVSAKRTKHSYDRPSLPTGIGRKECGHGRSSYCLVVPTIPSITWAYCPSDIEATLQLASLPSSTGTALQGPTPKNEGSRVRKYREVRKLDHSSCPARSGQDCESRSYGGTTRQGSQNLESTCFQKRNESPYGDHLSIALRAGDDESLYCLQAYHTLYTGFEALIPTMTSDCYRNALQGPFYPLGNLESYSYLDWTRLHGQTLSGESLQDLTISVSISSGSPTECSTDNRPVGADSIEYPDNVDSGTYLGKDMYSPSTHCPVGTDGIDRIQGDQRNQKKGSKIYTWIGSRILSVPRDRTILSNTNPNTDTPTPTTSSLTTPLSTSNASTNSSNTSNPSNASNDSIESNENSNTSNPSNDSIESNENSNASNPSNPFLTPVNEPMVRIPHFLPYMFDYRLDPYGVVPSLDPYGVVPSLDPYGVVPSRV